MVVQVISTGRRPLRVSSCIILTKASHLVIVGSLSCVDICNHALVYPPVNAMVPPLCLCGGPKLMPRSTLLLVGHQIFPPVEIGV